MVVPSLHKVIATLQQIRAFSLNVFTGDEIGAEFKETKYSLADSEVLLPLLIIPTRNNNIEKHTTPRPHPC